MPVYSTPGRTLFTSRSDAELARILAPRCAECGDVFPVATEPAEWSLLEMREISMMEDGPRESLIRFRKLDPAARNFLCGWCHGELIDA